MLRSAMLQILKIYSLIHIMLKPSLSLSLNIKIIKLISLSLYLRQNKHTNHSKLMM
jgi:hypothetical protein